MQEIDNRREGIGFLKQLPGRAIWHMPFRFHVAKALGPRYFLRSVLFHNISDASSPFTGGLGVTLPINEFEERIRFLARYYTPVALEEVFQKSRSYKIKRPVLVTFDDVYASVALQAAPICEKYGIPAILFVNYRFLDNKDLALDNLICYVANTKGVAAVTSVARDIFRSKELSLHSVAEIIGDFLPFLPLKTRRLFHERLADVTGLKPSMLASGAGLYLSSAQLQSLASSNFEIGNHTYSHVHGRQLMPQDFDHEIDDNKAALESVIGKQVRAYSAPYGYSADLPSKLVEHLQQSGHRSAFLVEGRVNPPLSDPYHLYRVSVQARNEAEFFSELEILPRLRSIRHAWRRRGAKELSLVPVTHSS
jgi:peptidoglycan/xylan/chitin deacetylase (PgdA/CDA1 family)